MNNEIRRPDLYSIIKQGVIDGLQKVREVKAAGKYIGRYYDFPKLDRFRSGFPHFTQHFDNNQPSNYNDVFGDNEKSEVVWNSIPSWKNFREFAEADTFLKNYFKLGDLCTDYPTMPNFAEWSTKYETYGTLSNFVDRFIHVSKATEFDEAIFESIYLEWEASVFLEKLPFEVCVPILCVNFDFQSEFLDGVASVEKMTDDFQLARNNQHDLVTSVHDCVIGAASHTLVLHGWSTITNRNKNEREATFNEFSPFSKGISRIDNFFAALRTVTGIETGYSQLVVRPSGWGNRWKAFLPRVYVVTTRAYPDHFENFGWLRDAPTVNADSISQVAEVYRALSETTANSLAIAARRLNTAYLRRDEADSILDVTIALEALLGDDSRTEMTHKLAMRMAALVKIEPCIEGQLSEIFDFIKKIYAYRSAIVHGSKKSENKRTVSNKRNEEIPTVHLGLKLLRHSILTLARHPQYLDPAKLDQFLIAES